MTGPAADAGFLAEPGAVIAGIIAAAEPALSQDGIAAAIGRAAPSRAQQRHLAAALSSDPGLLTSGRAGDAAAVRRLRPAKAPRPARRQPADLLRLRHPQAGRRPALRDLRQHQEGRHPGPAGPAALCPLPPVGWS